jgi:type I restriction enzyme, S subunit
MKKDWEVKKLGEVCEIELGKTPSRRNKSFWDTEKTTSNVWLSIADLLNGDGKFVSDSKEYVSDRGAEICKMVKTGTLLVSFKLTLGRLAFTARDIFTNEAIAALPIKNEKLLFKEYLYYYLSYFNWTSASDGDIKIKGRTLNKEKLKEIPIPLPSLTEQKRIVATMDEASTAIATAKENAEKNLQNSRDLFESYLQSVFVNPGDGWEKKTLKQMAAVFGRGKSKHRPRNDKKLYGGKYPFIQTGDIRNSIHYIKEYSQTYNEAGLAQSKLWPKGTICITIAANIAETGILSFDSCFPDSVIGLVVNTEVAETNYVEYLLQAFKIQLQAKGKGSAQDNINLGTFENALFPFPCLSEQYSIVARLDAISTETKKLEAIYQQKLADLAELKKSLLRRAFSGELSGE